MKALVVSTNTGCVGHVQGWCIQALVNVNLVKQPGGVKGDDIGKGRDKNTFSDIERFESPFFII
jgi:hypothetical protein